MDTQTLDRLVYLTNFLLTVADGDETKDYYVNEARRLLQVCDIRYRIVDRTTTGTDSTSA